VQLIDHGAALIFHHSWTGLDAWAERPYDVSSHALAGTGADVGAADAELTPLVTADLLETAVTDIPDVWLVDEPGFPGPDAVRDAYVGQLAARLGARDVWLPDLLAVRGRPGEAAS
jgi:hypothetical protein